MRDCSRAQSNEGLRKAAKAVEYDNWPAILCDAMPWYNNNIFILLKKYACTPTIIDPVDDQLNRASAFRMGSNRSSLGYGIPIIEPVALRCALPLYWTRSNPTRPASSPHRASYPPVLLV